ncbi:MAG: hypothetical protein QNI87_15275 [Erythrobacter sp.]|uniref:hypothetical protein n=1 Tax=Erythrobacter sp. TaxID=1042 RepID=UPI0026119380|nr:hypothetical protein [Erythrobacter sp.]MDJ0979886.1 hypothetical protein [Erythrobacter sp.]
MGRAGDTASQYTLPSGDLGLKGPVEKPAPGTLPLRGDLAHIALAGTHLAAHYVIPGRASVRAERTNMRYLARDDADVNVVLKKGHALEVLDIGKDWVWCCLGPEGPSGYVHTDCLDLTAG